MRILLVEDEPSTAKAIELMLTAARQDPAQSSSIILTTVTDVMGFLSFLGIATLFAGFLRLIR